MALNDKSAVTASSPWSSFDSMPEGWLCHSSIICDSAQKKDEERRLKKKKRTQEVHWGICAYFAKSILINKINEHCKVACVVLICVACCSACI